MTRRHVIAVVVAVAAMSAALLPPLWVSATGDEVYLEIEPVDPLSLVRGNYVDLRYDVDVDIPDGSDWDDAVYVVLTDDRPAVILRATVDRPDLAPGEFCLRGRARSDSVDFPQLEQFFVTPERGREIETNLRQYIAVVKVTGGSRAILVDLEPE